MGKNLYERRKARAAKPVPPAKYEQLERIVIKRAIEFRAAYMDSETWTKHMERKAMLLSLAVGALESRRVDKTPSGKESAK